MNPFHILIILFALVLFLAIGSLCAIIQNRFRIWRRKPFKTALCRAYSDGLINSYQMHEMAERFDNLQKPDRVKPKGGYAFAARQGTVACLLFIGALTATIPARAQTPPPTPDSFFKTATAWATTFDTNNPCFATDSLSLWNGVKYQSGLNVADSFGIDWTAKRFANGLSLTVGSATDMAGVTGIITAQEGTLGLSKTIWDLRLTPYVGGAYNLNLNKPYIPLGIDLRKAMTAHSFIGFRLTEPIYFKGKGQPLTVIGLLGITL
jgi:hypothetical protein